MFQATSRSELPNPQKALTKLTKGVVRGTFVSFVSAFLHPQTSKTAVLPPRRPRKLSFRRAFFHWGEPHGPEARYSHQAASSQPNNPIAEGGRCCTPAAPTATGGHHPAVLPRHDTRARDPLHLPTWPVNGRDALA
jgi:hypothetical protein